MPEDRRSRPSIVIAAYRYWRESASHRNAAAATWALLALFWDFLRDSTPFRARQRYGDADYDWDYRVNTTSGGVGWRERLLGVFHSAYQPTEPALFREMIAALEEHTNLNFADFTFVDLGSGKGRTLLMASDYPFRRIVGVEMLPALNQIAQQNLAHYKSETQRCFDMESICNDAAHFSLPAGPLVVFLFNPFPEATLGQVIGNLRDTLGSDPRPVYVIYLNPQHERVLEDTGLRKIAGSHQYSIFSAC